MTYSWATHRPLIQVALEVFNPGFVLEIGVGIHSTPLFGAVEYVGIENDKQWIDNVQSLMNEECNIIYNDLGGVNSSTKFSNLNKQTKIKIIKFLTGLQIPEKPVRLLFIDSFVCDRNIAMILLAHKFDIIIFHDAQPKSHRVYGYDLDNFKDFDLLYLTSDTAWTGMLTNLPEAHKKINNSIQVYIDQFRQDFNYNGQMKLTSWKAKI